MSQLVKELSSKTVKEVPGIVSKYASENLTQAKVQSRFMNWMERYRKEVRAGEDGGSLLWRPWPVRGCADASKPAARLR